MNFSAFYASFLLLLLLLPLADVWLRLLAWRVYCLLLWVLCLSWVRSLCWGWMHCPL